MSAGRQMHLSRAYFTAPGGSTRYDVALYSGDVKGGEGGSDEGQVLVRLRVDQQFDEVVVDLGSTDLLAAVEAAHAALDEMLGNLHALLNNDQMPLDQGRCLGLFADGRCGLTEGHEGKCS